MYLFLDLAQALGVGQKDTKSSTRTIHFGPTPNKIKQEKFTHPLLVTLKIFHQFHGRKSLVYFQLFTIHI